MWLLDLTAGWFVQLQSWELAGILVCNKEVAVGNAEIRVMHHSPEHPTLNWVNSFVCCRNNLFLKLLCCFVRMEQEEAVWICFLPGPLACLWVSVLKILSFNSQFDKIDYTSFITIFLSFQNLLLGLLFPFFFPGVLLPLSSPTMLAKLASGATAAVLSSDLDALSSSKVVCVLGWRLRYAHSQER